MEGTIPRICLGSDTESFGHALSIHTQDQFLCLMRPRTALSSRRMLQGSRGEKRTLAMVSGR